MSTPGADPRHPLWTRESQGASQAMIERIELATDTLVVLMNGHHLIVRDSPQELIDRIVEFRRRIGGTLCHFPVVEDKKSAYSTPKAEAG